MNDPRLTIAAMWIATTAMGLPSTDAAGPCPNLAQWTGSGGDWFGRSVAVLSDLDGDEMVDIIVGAPAWNDVGAAYVISGASGVVLHSFEGTIPDERFGWSVADAGDIDGDRVRDVIVGAPANYFLRSGPGRAVVFSGANGRLIAEVTGDASDDHFGISVLGLGDVNNDGRADFAVAAPYADGEWTNAGKVFVYSGMDQTVLDVVEGGWTNLQLGKSLAPITDLNDDGVSELAITSQAGVKILSGADRIELLSLPSDPQGQGRYVVADVGDVSGDGAADYAVGVPLASTDTGKVQLYSSEGQLLREYVAEPQHALYGCAVAAPGDVNGDGLADILVGASQTSGVGGGGGSGFVRLVSGFDGETLYETSGSTGEQAFGSSLAMLGDLDGDGHPEFLVGAPWNSPSGGLAGSVFRLSTGSGDNDCNGNGHQDSCDIDSGLSTDCNGNNVPDECEVAPIQLTSGVLVPIGSGQAHVFRLTDPLPAVGEVELTFAARADLGFSSENIDIALNGDPIGSVFVTGTPDCEYLPSEQSLILPASQWNAAVARGVAEIAMLPTPGVDPFLCPAGTFISATVSYQADAPVDANSDGVIDACVDTDCDDDGILDAAEIAAGAYDCDADGIPDDCPAATVLLDEPFPAGLSVIGGQPKWSAGTAPTNTVGINEPSGPFALNLDGGTLSPGEYAVTELVSLAGFDAARVEYRWQRTGGGDSPEMSPLEVRWSDDLEHWHDLAVYSGEGENMSGFAAANHVIKKGGSYPQVALWFRTYGHEEGSPEVNDWFIDDVRIIGIGPAPEPPDCNQNGTPDGCDIGSGTSLDCNGDGLPDECQDGLITFSSPVFPFIPGGGIIFTMPGPPEAVTEVTLLVEAIGDFGQPTEYFDVLINGVLVGAVYPAGIADCQPGNDELTMPMALWNDIVASGDATFTLDPSDAVGLPLPCLDEYVKATISYTALVPLDLDGDGELDSCSTEPADLNGDGAVDGFDLALLLGQWTGAGSYAPCPPHEPADLNSDCKINGFDLALLLGAWG